MLHYIRKTGAFILNGLQSIGAVTMFGLEALQGLNLKSFYWRNFLFNLLEIGFYSLPVIGITAAFTGAVLALQSYSGFSRFSAESSIATVVVLSITRELGPVIVGLMVSGRVGAAMAAEIGTMKVTDQIDALVTMSTNPVRYLATPRIVAATLVLPILVIIADIIGVFGGYLVSIHKLGFNMASYLKNTIDFLETKDIILGLYKAGIFGFLIAVISCYSGFNSGKGAQGVGRSTTNAVVASSIMILLANYITTELFFSLAG